MPLNDEYLKAEINLLYPVPRQGRSLIIKTILQLQTHQMRSHLNQNWIFATNYSVLQSELH
ncbi:hypothetical protein [Fischerella thermalis]|uniref:hypothetical protein n=1 Tax=Fischerella thermalis TaxID=372787 RepID=UPI0011AF88DE|nr:hypothetical protein [Fischerella thermalis]